MNDCKRLKTPSVLQNSVCLFLFCFNGCEAVWALTRDTGLYKYTELH